jgi:ketosteroid isomerase-like protein
MIADIENLLARFTGAVEAADGDALGALFHADGTYADTFYGAFTGPAAIADMLDNYFHRDAERFRWDMFDPVFDGRLGYAHWLFSYSSTFEDSAGTRVAFDGMSRFDIADGLIQSYDEVFSAGEPFVQLGMAPDRIEKILSRMTARKLERAKVTRHMDLSLP